ncbi:Spermatid nuclear transition protein 1, partial [Eschrichtius robustus]|nr:Spermatid nuclear transition protein 1 [Eschrichtius robustus]
MATSRKLKSHGVRKGKNRGPHKGVKRGGSKRKYQKGSLKSRKRCNDAGSALVDFKRHQATTENRRGTAKET